MDNEELKKQPMPKNGFLEFLRRIWSAKITFGVTFGVTLILVATLMGTVLNKMRATYETETIYNFSGCESGRFADGTAYNYRNNVSYENLVAAQQTDPSFESINVKGMAAGGGISVEMVEEVIDEKTTNKTPAHLKYTVKQSYFASAQQATRFMDALVSIPTNKAISIAVSRTYGYYLQYSKEALSYDSQIHYLNSQYSLIADGYNNLLDAYGASLTYFDKNGNEVLVSETASAFTNFFSVYSVETLKEVLYNYGFCKDTDTMAAVEARARIMEIDRSITKNTSEIEALTLKYEEIYKGQSTTGDSPFAGRIQQLIAENVALEQEKEYLQKKLDNISGEKSEEYKKAQAEFETQVSYTSARMQAFVDDYTTVCHSVSQKSVFTTFANSAHTVGSGSFAWYVCVIGGVAAGAVLGIAVAYFKGVSNLERKSREE